MNVDALFSSRDAFVNEQRSTHAFMNEDMSTQSPVNNESEYTCSEFDHSTVDTVV